MTSWYRLGRGASAQQAAWLAAAMFGAGYAISTSDGALWTNVPPGMLPLTYVAAMTQPPREPPIQLPPRRTIRRTFTIHIKETA